MIYFGVFRSFGFRIVVLFLTQIDLVVDRWVALSTNGYPKPVGVLRESCKRDRQTWNCDAVRSRDRKRTVISLMDTSCRSQGIFVVEVVLMSWKK